MEGVLVSPFWEAQGCIDVAETGRGMWYGPAMEFSTRTVSLSHIREGLDFEVLDQDSIIGPSIEKGSWADEETQLMCAHIEPGNRVVDLGANVGWFAVQAVLADAEVDAFEPVPGIAEIAQRNVDRAMAVSEGRGTVHVMAAGAERGQAEIALSDDNRGDNRLMDDDVPSDMGEVSQITIDVVPVDEVVQGAAHFLKVDTQGSEWLALQGAKALLKKSPRLGLLIELWPYALRGATPRQLIGFLLEQGFTLGKATAAPYPMSLDRILSQIDGHDPLKAGMDLYGAKGGPFHVLGTAARLRGMLRSIKEV